MNYLLAALGVYVAIWFGLQDSYSETVSQKY